MPENNTILELKTFEVSRRRFKTYIGSMGEMIASEILLREGFRVWGLKPYHAGGSQKRDIFSDNLYICLSFLYPPSNSRFYDAPLGYEKTREKAIKELEEFFGDKLVAFKKYTEGIGVAGKVGVVGACQINISEPSEHIYTPDLVCRKGDEIYIVEVKTDSANLYLKPERVKGLLLARKFGLIPLLIHIKVNIDASDFVLQELNQ